MQPISDVRLLREYAEQGKESAFAEITARHTNLVYSAALRQVESPDLAAEVAQQAFIGLARGAQALSGKLAEDASLAGWLCRIVRNLSLNLRRDEFRRQSRERQAMAQLDSAPETLPDWEQLRPLLDEAMTELSEIDYDAIVLRFYQKQDLRSVGRTLGLSDDAAQKRVSRAVERLRESFAKRGVTIGAGGLVAAISANAVQAAPAGLAATISAAAVLAAATLATTTAVTTSATATATAAASKTIVMTALQKAAIVTLLVAAVGTGIYQVRHPAPKREPKPAPPPEQAAQVETAPLEGRPDDSPNLEPTDPAPAAQIEVVVQTSDGLPISNAKVRILAEQTSGKSPDRIDRTQITDAKGGTRISYPPAQDLERLEIAASHEDYGGLKMCWEMRAGDSIPASYTFKLGNGITIGGRVMDESDAPIAGANLSLRRFWLGGEDIVRRGEQSDFASRSTRSDAQGLWQVKGVPTDLLDHIDIRASHPDYVETEYSGGSDGMDQQLRAGTSKVTLRRGPWVAGRVIDESGNPIAGATVTAGKYNNQGTQETKTDTRGAFGFRNLSLGEIQFGALAKGWKPEIRTVEVKPDMPEILFRLGPGQKVWGIVKTEAGEPLAGVRISLESKIGGVSDTYELALDSDQDGRFEWDGAPDEVQNFCFLKMGYEAKRSQTLKPSEENVITLRQARKIEGRVLDATTEQPLTKFRVGIGRYSGADTFYADYPGMRECADTNGRFSLGASEEETGAVKAEADDYASQIERLPAAQNGVVQVVLRLKPSAALRGVLVTPDGAPVPGATVGISSGKPGGMPTLKNARLVNSGWQGKVVTTDAAGEFVVPSPPVTGTVVAAEERGFGSASIQQVRDSGRLVLQAFGRIEGKYTRGGQPVAGQHFTLSMKDPAVSFEWGEYKTTTDENGRFTIDRVPPGAGEIVRLVSTAPNLWVHNHGADVKILSGQTAQVTLGD